MQLADNNIIIDLEVNALNSIIKTKNLAITPVTNLTVGALLGDSTLISLLTETGLYPLKLSAGAVATCTTATIPAGGIQLALAGMCPPFSVCGRSKFHTVPF